MTPGNRSNIPMVPWGRYPEWREANQSIQYLCRRYGRQLEPAAGLARQVKNQYETLSPLMDELCMVTCRICKAPCCRHAKIWYDERDLLMFHLVRMVPPPSQVISTLRDTCCYLGKNGCTLPRPSRPFICTWYVCPAQHDHVRGKKGNCRNRLMEMIQEIKQLRIRMENVFIQVTAGCSRPPGRTIGGS